MFPQGRDRCFTASAGHFHFAANVPARSRSRRVSDVPYVPENVTVTLAEFFKNWVREKEQTHARR